MPWYGWCILFLAFCMIISPLFSLLKDNQQPKLTDEQLRQIKARNAALDEIQNKQEQDK